ncbi:hypothetical protein H5410_023027 [Solanum commersonii]|uniref:AT-hook motif nuclear-localized protein n=1 Tax=Solanum commersonii TaxID=4109 RepID=A0A9J5ZGF1_SOLCO|nr:hypothetical protein H5410_023027 [Solanum commersonii]
MNFLQQEEMEISIQSVTGEVCSVSFEEMGGDIVTYENRFRIISLIKSFIVVESSRICGLHVLLSRPDHSVIGGYAFVMRMAATPVEVVVRFIPENEEPGYDDAFKGYDDAPMLIT